MTEAWDRPERPKGSCAHCARLHVWVPGDRGPVKTALVMTKVGNFAFCDECLSRAVTSERPDPVGPYVHDIVTIDTHTYWVGHHTP